MSTPPVPLPNYGYVSPSLTNGELNDLLLRRLLNLLVSGIVTEIKPENVRPRWQPDPANQPGFDIDWAAIGVLRKTRDAMTAEIHISDTQSQVYRSQILEILASFYGPNAEANSEVFAMGLGLAQNREQIFLNGFGLIDVNESVNVPFLVKGTRWLSGWDVGFRMRRQQIYTFDVPSLAKAVGTITTDYGEQVPFAVQQ